MGRKEKEYIVYDRVSDMPIVIGTTSECSKALGISNRAFHNMIWCKNRFDIFDLDILLKDYNEEKIFNK